MFTVCFMRQSFAKRQWSWRKLNSVHKTWMKSSKPNRDTSYQLNWITIKWRRKIVYLRASLKSKPRRRKSLKLKQKKRKCEINCAKDKSKAWRTRFLHKLRQLLRILLLISASCCYSRRTRKALVSKGEKKEKPKIRKMEKTENDNKQPTCETTLINGKWQLAS